MFIAHEAIAQHVATSKYQQERAGLLSNPFIVIRQLMLRIG